MNIQDDELRRGYEKVKKILSQDNADIIHDVSQKKPNTRGTSQPEPSTMDLLNSGNNPLIPD